MIWTASWYQCLGWKVCIDGWYVLFGWLAWMDEWIDGRDGMDGWYVFYGGCKLYGMFGRL
jgi:hypothetical protein